MKYETIIHYNGSKCAGEDPDSLETLFALLATEPLEPALQRICFERRIAPACATHTTHHFQGNFYAVSHAFSVETNDPKVIERFQNLIAENVGSDAFKAARRTRSEQEEIKQAYLRSVRRRRLGKTVP